MKKILLSLLVISSITAVGYLGTQALFSDTETSTGNTFTTGTIDIAVDGENPWEVTDEVVLSDMKPSYTGYIDFVIYNEGNNPANVWKTLKNFVTDPGTMSEPECEAEGGTWVDYGDHCTGETAVDNLHNKIRYDLYVGLYRVNPDDDPTAEPVWWETIYIDEDDVRLSSLQNKKMLLGMIPSGWWLKVEQSYHMPDWVGNKYQGDRLTFDIELYAEQLTNTVVLENKEEVAFEGLSHTMLGDGIYAELTYKVMDDEFVYKLDVFGMPDEDYTLIKYDDPLDGSDPWPAPGSLALVNVTVSGGSGSVTGSIDLAQDMVNAKLWLVKKTYTPGAPTGNLSWSPTTTLFETGLADYYDSDK